jgi:hypothetical protein
VDCGELLPGHRFLITGVRLDGRSDDQLHADFTGHVEGQPGEPMVSVTYEVRPGLSEQESTLYVYPEVELSPTPTGAFWEATSRDGGNVAEERDQPADGPVTAGAFGPFVCPEGTEEIALRLRPIQVTTVASDGQRIGPDSRDLLAGVPLETGGTATLDLQQGTGYWAPAHGEDTA